MWVDGYWQGKMRDGYPESYFESGRFEYPWEKNVKKVLDSQTKCDIVVAESERQIGKEATNGEKTT